MRKSHKELIMEKDTAYGAKELQKAETKRKRRKKVVSQHPARIADSSSYKNLFYGALAVVVLFAVFVLAMRLFAPKGTITPEAAKTSLAVITLPPNTIVHLSPYTTTPEKSVKHVKKVVQPTPAISPTPSAEPAQVVHEEKKYTVQRGDSLWTISEKEYSTGYNWTQIAQANNITNPGVIYAGTKLVIPVMSPSPIAQASPQNVSQTKGGVTIQNNSPNAITTVMYTVRHGDDLWNIAVRAYGDGYKWVDIAQANNLSNPSLIFSGNVLKIPRE